MSDVNNVTGGLLRDTLGGRVADRTARTAVQEIRCLHRGVKVAEEVGPNKLILDGMVATPRDGIDETDGVLLEEERRLTEQLEAVRARRVAGRE